MPEPRARRREDADALDAHSRRLAGTADSSAAEVESWFGLPGLDPERDLRVVGRPEGGIAGHADVAGGKGDEPLWPDLPLRLAAPGRARGCSTRWRPAPPSAAGRRGRCARTSIRRTTRSRSSAPAATGRSGRQVRRTDVYEKMP